MMADMMVPEEWREGELSDFCDVVGGGTPDRNNPDFWRGDIPWASPTEITNLTSKYISQTKENITKLGLDKSSAKLHPAGTLLMTSRASIGYVAINTVPMATNQGFQSLRCKEKILVDFLYQYIAWSRPQLERLAAGSTFAEISSANVKKLEVCVPPLPEQQKIATILTSVDTVIEKTRAQIDKLKHLKTGMMQQLLTQGIGHTEFKDTPVGPIPKTWKVISLGKAGSWKGGGTPSKANKEFWNGNIPWVSPKDMKSEFIEKTEDYITEHAITASSTNNVPASSILIVARSGILKHTLPVAIAAVDVTINQDMKALIVNDKVLALYLFHYLKANNHKVLRATLKAGNTVESLDFSEFSQHQIPLPPVSEQQKIIDVMESIANRLRSKQQQLKSYEQTKKALMQDLLTGNVRI